MLGHELHPQRRQVQQAEGERHVEAQQAPGVAAARGDLRLGLVDTAQQLAAAPCLMARFVIILKTSGGFPPLRA